jgi:hypothetical protein
LHLCGHLGEVSLGPSNTKVGASTRAGWRDRGHRMGEGPGLVARAQRLEGVAGERARPTRARSSSCCDR